MAITEDNPIFQDSPNTRMLLTAAILLLVTVTYFNSFPGAFHYDDFGLFLENPEIRQQARHPASLLTLYGGRPLSLLSLDLNLLLCGEDPFWFHLVNVLLHLAVTSLLFFLVAGWSSSIYTGFLTALIFGLHPLQAQAVNYIWARSVLLMALFLFLSILVSEKSKKTWPGLLFFQLAVWSRMDALAALPIMILMNRRKKGPVLILGSINLAAAGYSMFSADNADMAWNHSSPAQYILEAPLNLLRYIKFMFNPGEHSIFHAYPESGIIKIAASFCLVAIIVFILVKNRKTQPLLFTGPAWLILMLLPSLLIPNADPVNESRAYYAFAGIALLTAVVLTIAGRSAGEKLSAFVTGSRKRLIAGLVTVLVSAACVPILALKTTERNFVWKDDLRIWREAVSMNPENHLPVYNLGIALIRNGEFEEGCGALARAIKLNPLDDMSYSAAGYCFEVMGETEKAKAYYSRAMEINPENKTALESLESLGDTGIKQ
ncbi:MAG: hypothetical protein ABIJ42_04295 [Acidobacteriota bacterium]